MSIESPQYPKKDVKTPSATEAAQVVDPTAKSREGWTKKQRIIAVTAFAGAIGLGAVGANVLSSNPETTSVDQNDDNGVRPNETSGPLTDTTPTNLTPLETAAPTASGEVKTGTVAEAMKFYVGDGEEFQTFEDVQKAATFTIDDYPKQIETIALTVERMEAVANYRPTEKTVRASVNKPTEQLTREDYELVMEQYRLAHDVMFASTSGDFYDTLKQVSQQAAFNYLLTIDEEQPYEVKLTLHTNNTGLRITDNSLMNTIDDNLSPYLGDYRLSSSSNGRDITQDNGKWQVAGNMELLKQSQ